MTLRGISHEDRRLAEAVRFLQRREPGADADIAVRPEPGEALESLIVRRARSHPQADRLRDQLRRLDRVLAGITGGWMALMLVLGVAATAAVLRGPRDAEGLRTLNLLEFVGGILGVQSLLLLAWAVLTVALPRSVVPGLLSWLPRETLRRRLRLRGRRGSGGSSAVTIAAARATAEPLATAGIARAEAGVLTHGSWVMFNLGVILALVVLLGTRGYRVTWETTLLSPSQGERLVRVLLSVPRAAGLPGPDEAAVARASIGGGSQQPEEDRRAWGWAIVGMVATMGLAPRAGLLAGAAILRAGRRAAWRLDLEQPEHQSLRARLERAATTVRIEQPPDPSARPGPGPRAADSASAAAAADADAPVWALRLDAPPPAAWPPPLDAVRWKDLGEVDGREDERAAVGEVAATPSGTLLLAADLACTPDRGHARFIGELVAAASGRVRLVLTGGQALRRRVGGDAEAVGRRVEAWRGIAAAGGIGPEHVLECDLDHATRGSLAGLAAILGRPDAAVPPIAGGLDASLTLIVEAVGRWTGEPGPGDLAELHLAIHRSHGAAPDVFASRRGEVTAAAALREAAGRLAAADPQSMATAMQRGAREMLDRLPAGLRSGGRWAVAGSIAGACGCLAAAVAVAPVAITALPAWAGGGAVLAATLRALASAASEDRGEPSSGLASGPADVSVEVDAAVLQCLVLHLQGRPEAGIAAILERVLGPMSDPPPPLAPGDRDGARQRTDAIRDRMDRVMAERARGTAGMEGGRP